MLTAPSCCVPASYWHLSATLQTMSITVANLQDNWVVFRIFITLLRFSFDSPSYGTRAENGKHKYFHGTRHSLLSQYLLFLCPTTVTILWTLCVYTHIGDYVQTVYELPLLPINTALKLFYANRSGAKCWLDIYRWGAGLAAAERIRDIGQNVLQASCLNRMQQWPQLLSHFLPHLIPRRGLFQKDHFFLPWRNSNPPPSPSGQGLSRFHDHSDTPHYLILLWTSDQSDAETTTCTTHNTHNRQTSMPRWDSNPRSQQASGRRPTP